MRTSRFPNPTSRSEQTVTVCSASCSQMGLYGSISYAVNRRRRELGIRMALDSDGTQILRGVLREGIRLVILGTALGSLGALGVMRLLAHSLETVQRFDPLSVTIAVVVLAATGVGCRHRSRSPGRETETSPPEGAVLALEKRRITASEAVIEVIVTEQPRQAGIDPFNKLIDRNPENNLTRVNAETAASSGSD